jgi:WD40 repeat protein
MKSILQILITGLFNLPVFFAQAGMICTKAHHPFFSNTSLYDTQIQLRAQKIAEALVRSKNETLSSDSQRSSLQYFINQEIAQIREQWPQFDQEFPKIFQEVKKRFEEESKKKLESKNSPDPNKSRIREQLKNLKVMSPNEIFQAEYAGAKATQISLDGSMLATARIVGGAGEWQIYSIKSGKLLHSGIAPNSRYINHLRFSPDGRFLVIINHDNILRLIDTKTGIEVSRTQVYKSYNFEFDPTGKYIVSTDEGFLTIHDFPSGRVLETFNYDPSRRIAMSNDGTLLAFRTRDMGIFRESLKLLDMQTGKVIVPNNIDYPSNHQISPNGKVLVVLSESNKLIFLDPTTGQIIRALELSQNRTSGSYLEFSPDGKFLAVSFGDEKLAVIDVATGKVKFEILHQGKVNSLKFSPNGQLLAFTNSTNQLSMIDLATGSTLYSIQHDSQSSFTFSADGRHFASGSSENELSIFSTIDGNKIFGTPMLGTTDLLEFTPDGEYLVQGKFQRNVHVYKVYVSAED